MKFSVTPMWLAYIVDDFMFQRILWIFLHCVFIWTTAARLLHKLFRTALRHYVSEYVPNFDHYTSTETFVLLYFAQ